VHGSMFINCHKKPWKFPGTPTARHNPGRLPLWALLLSLWKETLLALMMTMMYCRTCWFLLFAQLQFGSKQIKINQENQEDGPQ